LVYWLSHWLVDEGTTADNLHQFLFTSSNICTQAGRRRDSPLRSDAVAPPGETRYNFIYGVSISFCFLSSIGVATGYIHIGIPPKSGQKNFYGVTMTPERLLNLFHMSIKVIFLPKNSYTGTSPPKKKNFWLYASGILQLILINLGSYISNCEKGWYISEARFQKSCNY